MEFWNVLTHRKMVRDYTLEPVQRSTIERIVSAATHVPSAGNSQGQRVTVITSVSMRQKIAHLAGEPEWVKKGKDPWLSVAPLHIVLATDIEAYRHRYSEPDKHTPGTTHPIDMWDVPYWWVDSGATLMALLLATTAEGLSAGFLGSHAIPGLHSLLELPNETKVTGLITVGHSADSPVVGSALRPKDDRIVTWMS